MPDGLKRIGDKAFIGCSFTEKVFIYSKNVEIGDSSFHSTSVVLYGYRNSTAQKYAVEHGLVFEELK